MCLETYGLFLRYVQRINFLAVNQLCRKTPVTVLGKHSSVISHSAAMLFLVHKTLWKNQQFYSVQFYIVS